MTVKKKYKVSKNYTWFYLNVFRDQNLLIFGDQNLPIFLEGLKTYLKKNMHMQSTPLDLKKSPSHVCQ